MSNMKLMLHEKKLQRLYITKRKRKDPKPHQVDLAVLLQKLVRYGIITTWPNALDDIEKLLDKDYELTGEMRSALKALGFDYEDVFSLHLIDDVESILLKIHEVPSSEMRNYYKILFGITPSESDQSMDNICDLFSELIKKYGGDYRGKFAILDKRIISTGWLYNELRNCKELMPLSLASVLTPRRLTYGEAVRDMTSIKWTFRS